MSDFWIVAAADLEELQSLEEANALKQKLARHVPDRRFKIYRCKRFQRRAEHFPKLVALLKEIVATGCVTAEQLVRARLLMFTIGNRERTSLTENYSVPEFDPRAIRGSRR